MAEIKPSEVTSILRQQLENFNQKSEMEEVGTVLLVGDGIARVYGLHNVCYGELVTFRTKNGDEITGIALNLEEDNVGVVLLGDSKSLNEGDICKRTGSIASIKVGEGLLKMHVGEIYTFALDADTIAKYLDNDQMPANYQPGKGQKCYYKINLQDIVTRDEILQEQANCVANMRQMEEAEPELIQDYLEEN
ncbi:MAG: hypothetical protein II001_00780, partial [Bacteroidales bacterium]|nr:hypothetical protein [Bacteroidales bacterium]